MPIFGTQLADWKLQKQQFPTGITAATRHRDVKLTAKRNELLTAPLESPIARKLVIKDMLHDERMRTARTDKFSHEVLINHNVYTYVLAGIRANEIAFGTPNQLPSETQEAMVLITTLFQRDGWMDLLKANTKLLKMIKA